VLAGTRPAPPERPAEEPAAALPESPVAEPMTAPVALDVPPPPSPSSLAAAPATMPGAPVEVADVPAEPPAPPAGLGLWVLLPPVWRGPGAGGLAGVSLRSVRLLGGWLQVRSRRRGGRPAPAEWSQRLGKLAERLGVRRAVRLCESALVEVPAVVG